MTPNRMPDYRLPNERGILGQAGMVLHRIRILFHPRRRRPGPFRPDPHRAGRSAACLTAVLLAVHGGAHASPDGRIPASVVAACAAADRPAESVTAAIRRDAASSLAGVIVYLRDTALRLGTQPMPRDIRAQLEGFVPDDVLDAVRWRGTDGIAPASLAMVVSMGVVAVTVDHVVLFMDDHVARNNAGLWAHELRHLMQYADCGVDAFAFAYLHDRALLEQDAHGYALDWHQWTLDNWLERISGAGLAKPLSSDPPRTP